MFPGRGPGRPPYPHPPPGYAGGPGYGANPYLMQGVRPPMPFNPTGGYIPPTRPAIQRKPGVPPPKNTTLWVGKIASTVEPELIRQLLEACGPIRDWKPATDPETGKMKGFGFCSYQEAEGVLLALKLLNGLNVDGQELALKCNKATEEYMDWFKGYASATATGAEPMAVDGQQTPEPQDKLAEAESKTREQINALIANRTVGVSKEHQASTSAKDVIASLQTGGDATQISMAPIIEKPDKRKRERDLERELEREKQRQRREEQRKADQEERAYRDAVRAWEAKEREIHRERDRFLDRDRDLQRERTRQLRVDNELPDTDDEEEPWNRRPYYNTRKATDRRRRKEQELRDEAADREKELEEIKQQQEKEAKALEEQNKMVSTQSAAALKGNIAEAAVVRRKTARVVLEEEEEEVKPKRELIPIKYTEEELQMMGAEVAPTTTAEANNKQSATGGGDVAAKKQLMAMVPKDRAGVFAFNMKWEKLDSAPADVKQRISSWVSKKIKELMGEEEPSFCEFIMSQVNDHTAAEEMLKALRDVLDEDADNFIVKLYQVLIYESLKLE